MLETTLKTQNIDPNKVMSESDFADFGIHNVAYIRRISPSTAMALFPELDDIEIEEALYSLHAADGTPLVLARTYHDALETADTNELSVQTLQ